jgi:GNAT superfamily N-acetyltransferase
MNPTAFSQTEETLKHCRLTQTLSPAQATVLAELLAASEPWLTLNISASALAKYLLRTDPALKRYTVEVQGVLVGVICLRYPWLRGPYIELLGLAADFRGLGIGGELLAWAESQARLECQNLWVVASAFNQKALAFYQHHGFGPVGLLPDLVLPGHDEVLLRKSWG